MPDLPAGRVTMGEAVEGESRSISGSLLSVVVPVFNEEENLALLHERLVGVMKSLGCDYEILMVDDGSTDGSLAVMDRLAREDDRVSFISFTRNFGHESATSAGLDFASGDAVVLIDADLQDPPEVIEEMACRWEEGFDVVYGRRHRRASEPLLKRASSFLFYRLMRKISGVDIPVDTGDFRLMDRRMVGFFKQLREKNRFVRAQVAWLGGNTTEVLYDRAHRHSGVTKYNTARRLKLSLDGIISFSTVPLHVISILGLIIFFLSILGGLVVLAQKLFFGISVPGYAFLVISLFLLEGAQILFIGVVGEYLARVYKETKDRPVYFIGAMGGFKDRIADGEVPLSRDART